MCRYLDDWLFLASSCPLILQVLGTSLQLCHELGIVVSWEESSPEIGVSWSDPGLHSFQGFPLPAESREAMLNRRRIPVWRQATRIFVEKAVRNSVSPDGNHSRGVRLWLRSLQLRPHLLWIGWFLCDSIESGVSPGSGMVDRGGSSSVRHFYGSGQPSPRLLVWLLRHGVWSSSSGCVCFRPLGSGGSSSVDQRQGVACGGVRSLQIPTRSVQLIGGNLADNSTALAYLHKQGGTRSPLLNSIVLRILPYIGRPGDSHVWIHGWCRCWDGVIFAIPFGFYTFYGIHPLPH